MRLLAENELTGELYAEILRILNDRQVGYAVGGSFASSHYTEREPHTKDLDIFLPPAEADAALDALAGAGLEVERPFPYWLAKAHREDLFVDIIYRAASGLWEVEQAWLSRAKPVQLWGTKTRVLAVEELIWSKAALMDRDRFDGNDVMHLLLAKAHDLDWTRLRTLAGDDWRLLLMHLTMFGYVYPDKMSLIPKSLLAEMSLHLLNEKPFMAADGKPLCRGTLVSNSQYLLDVDELGYQDARLQPAGNLRPEDLKPWDEAVKRGDT